MKDVFIHQGKINNRFALKLIFAVYLVLAGLSQFDIEQLGPTPYKVIHALMGSLFTQKWTMFAPHPLSFSQQIQFECNPGESKRIWLESLKTENSAMASITRQKMIFYFEDYVSAINVEVEKLHKNGVTNISKELAKYSMSLPVVQNLAVLLARECNDQVPASVDFVKIWIQPEMTERIHLWGI
jgi:hypothetical protein